MFTKIRTRELRAEVEALSARRNNTCRNGYVYNNMRTTRDWPERPDPRTLRSVEELEDLRAQLEGDLVEHQAWVEELMDKENRRQLYWLEGAVLTAEELLEECPLGTTDAALVEQAEAASGRLKEVSEEARRHISRDVLTPAQAALLTECQKKRNSLLDRLHAITAHPNLRRHYQQKLVEEVLELGGVPGSETAVSALRDSLLLPEVLVVAQDVPGTLVQDPLWVGPRQRFLRLPLVVAAKLPGLVVADSAVIDGDLTASELEAVDALLGTDAYPDLASTLAAARVL